MRPSQQGGRVVSLTSPRSTTRRKSGSTSKPKRATKAEPAKTSSAREDYLECISQLIGSKGYARAVDIAATLEIRAGERDEYDPAAGDGRAARI